MTGATKRSTHGIRKLLGWLFQDHLDKKGFQTGTWSSKSRLGRVYQPSVMRRREEGHPGDPSAAHGEEVLHYLGEEVKVLTMREAIQVMILGIGHPDRTWSSCGASLNP